MNATRFSLEIRPRIPERLNRLVELANDLLYTWDSSVRSLFIRLDQELWEECGHNPKVFLRRIAQKKLEAATEDPIYIQDYNRVLSSYDAYHTYWKKESVSKIRPMLNPDIDLVAYFCAEFGFHESFPIYSGGLGILAGDHCKAASDLGVPFVAVGMLYRQGYFNQTIDGQGQQVAHYFQTDPEDLPIVPAVGADGKEIHVLVSLPHRNVELKVWLAKAGHITLYLLDSDLAANSPEDRAITHQLYGGNSDTRIQQEIVLGIGGVRALRAAGLNPTVWHINEGHAAFQILERCREYVADSHHDFATALELVSAATVFTTHTPVPAGHDIFKLELITPYFKNFMRETGIDIQIFKELGASASNVDSFNMTALAMRGSKFHNGVSRIHGSVASQMEHYIWPEIPAEENPIGYVTNGVHVPTFLAREWINLLDMHFGGGWRNQLLNEEFWEAIEDIPDHSYWSIRQSLKTKLFNYVYKQVSRQHYRNGCSPTQIDRLTQYLAAPEKDILTIGFARRFATYKRATLLFSDAERLARIVNDPERPVMFIFAGKAHPQDVPGQQLLKTIHSFSRRPEFEGRIILVENYDLAMARKLVTGVDVWLNNPEYPLEASGTSGEKAGINGVLNLSVLDGWWGEGYDGENGWAITPHDRRFDSGFRDHEESNELLDLLETQIAPLYYSRSHHGYSTSWVKKSKTSMKTLMPHFNAQRMVMEYVSKYYSMACQHYARLSTENAAPANLLANWKKKITLAWPKVRIRRLDKAPTEIMAGDTLAIEIAAYLDGLDTNDIYIECLLGKDLDGQFEAQEIYRLEATGQTDNGEHIFRLNLNSPISGLQYYKIRIYPYHELLGRRFEIGFMKWL